MGRGGLGLASAIRIGIVIFSSFDIIISKYLITTISNTVDAAVVIIMTKTIDIDIDIVMALAHFSPLLWVWGRGAMTIAI